MIWFSASGTAPIKPKVYNDGFDFFGDEWEELYLYTKEMAYSTMSYKYGKRKKSNVEGYGSIIIYDIDDGYTGQTLKKATDGFKRLIVTTMSHTKEHPRMRLLLPLDMRIPDSTNADQYKELMLSVAKVIGLDVEKIDKSCLSTDRQYAPNPKQQHFYFDGEVLELQPLLDYAKTALQPKITLPKPISPVFNNNSSMMPLKDMRQYIKSNHSFDLMKSEVEAYGLSVKNNGDVVIPGSKTTAITINPKTGILRDWSDGDGIKDGKDYDVVSLHVDHYKDMTLAEATKHFYAQLGGR